MSKEDFKDTAFAASVTERQDEQRPCFDPDCGGIAEPEQDGEHCKYWSCADCGNDFGFERLQPNVITEDADGTCQVGIPEAIRRSASQGMTKAISEEAARAPVEIGLTIGKK
jgi:hypothetical protein